MAAKLPDKDQVRELIQKLTDTIEKPGELDTHTANALIETSRTLIDTLETQSSSPLQWTLQNVMPCLKIACDLNIFNTLAADKGQSKTAAELAESSHADPLLIARIMRVLAAAGFVKEVGATDYTCNRKCEMMANETPERGLQHAFSTYWQVAGKAPEFFKATGYQNPTLATTGTPFQYAWDTKDYFFQWLQKRPAISENFDAFMACVRNNRVDWLDWFPVEQEVLNGAKNDAGTVLMVDIGGGRGRDLTAFKAKFPEALGRFILEDQQHVIEHAEEGIEKVAHDFFTPQPVVGARFYFTHYILHDWDDESCIKILEHTASAMIPGYSKIYMNEWILPDVGCSLYEALLDIQMMLALAGMQRTRSQWQELLQKAGFKSVKFWTPNELGEGIIEASL